MNATLSFQMRLPKQAMFHLVSPCSSVRSVKVSPPRIRTSDAKCSTPFSNTLHTKFDPLFFVLNLI